MLFRSSLRVLSRLARLVLCLLACVVTAFASCVQLPLGCAGLLVSLHSRRVREPKKETSEREALLAMSKHARKRKQGGAVQ